MLALECPSITCAASKPKRARARTGPARRSRWIADTEVRNAKGQRVKKLRVTSSSIARLSNRIVGQLIDTGKMPVAGAGATGAAAAETKPEPPPAPTQPRLVIRPFTGAQAAKFGAPWCGGLRPEPVELFPNKQFVEKAKSLGVDLEADGAHVAPASALALSGLFEGDVLREDGVWSAYVRLVDGRSATVISQHYYDAKHVGRPGEVRTEQVSVPTFARTSRKLGVVAVPAAVAIVPVTAVAAAPVPIEQRSTKDEAKVKYKARPPKDQRPAAVDIELDFRLVHRNFDVQRRSSWRPA